MQWGSRDQPELGRNRQVHALHEKDDKDGQPTNHAYKFTFQQKAGEEVQGAINEKLTKQNQIK